MHGDDYRLILTGNGGRQKWSLSSSQGDFAARGTEERYVFGLLTSFWDEEEVDSD